MSLHAPYNKNDDLTLQPEYAEIVRRLAPEMQAQHEKRIRENVAERKRLLRMRSEIDQYIADNLREARVLNVSLGPDRMRGWKHTNPSDVAFFDAMDERLRQQEVTTQSDMSGSRNNV